MQNKIWVCKEISKTEIDRLSVEAGISRLLAKIFLNRGVSDAGYVRDFLNPCLDGLYDPFLLKDMDVAVSRIVKAVECDEHIVIYGDYDVDGVAGTSVLLDFLVSLGANVEFYIPDRLEDGYGLSISTADKVLQKGASILITVDCGITAIDEVKYINSHHMQVIITDHHECMEILPEAFAVINPCRPDCTYPFKELAGVGVVFKLVHALCLKMGIGELYKKYLDLTALGTVADVVPLINENRIIVKYGLAAMEKSQNAGIKALMDVAGLKNKPVTAYGVSFALAPRINAAGRMGSAARTVEMFTGTDPQQAYSIASKLNEENRHRQETEQVIFKQALEFVKTRINLESEKVIVASGEAWHHGIIGIVASKITERYHRPCILISEENGIGKGSGRSIEGFNLFKALIHCDNLLEKFGGHELAAGLSIKTDNLEEFKKKINEYADDVMTAADLIPSIKIDAYIGREEITADNIEELDLLAPFGSGNPGPVFAYDGFRVGEIRLIGENKHLKLRLEAGGFNFDAIGFNMGDMANIYSSSDTVDSVFTLELNTWNNLCKVQLNLKDIRPHKYIVFNESNDYNINDGIINSLSFYKAEEIVPERADLALVYKHFKVCCSNQSNNRPEVCLEINDLSILARTITDRYKVSMSCFKLEKSIEIFEELKLIKREPLGKNGMIITIFTDTNRTNLEDSPVYMKLQGLKEMLRESNGGNSSA